MDDSLAKLGALLGRSVVNWEVDYLCRPDHSVGVRVDVTLRGANIRMPKHILNNHQVLTALCQPGPEGMAQVMNAQVGTTDLFACGIKC